jgi:hypothetical protein
MAEMGKIKLRLTVLVVLCITVGIWALIVPRVSQAVGADKNPSLKDQGYAGSVSCRECHERFYQLWCTSFHGLAMQPYTPQFAKAKLSPQKKDITRQKQLRGGHQWR